VLSENTVGKLAFLIVAPLSVFGVATVLPNNESASENLSLWLLGSVLSTALLGIGLLIGVMPVRRARSHPLILPVVVGCVALVAGSLRGVGVVISFEIFGATDIATPTGRILVSTVVFAFWLILIGSVITSWTNHQRKRRELLDELVTRQLQLLVLDPQRPPAIGAETFGRVAEVSREVTRILNNAELSDVSEYKAVSNSLKVVIDERLRPLLHQLWSAQAPEVTTQPSTRSFLRRSLVTPIPVALALSLYAVVVTIAGVERLGVSVGLPIALIEWVSLAALVLGERRWFPTPQAIVRIFLLVGVGILPVFLAWLVVGRNVEPQIGPFAVISIALAGPIIVFVMCGARAALNEGGPSVADLRELLEDDQWDKRLRDLESHSQETEFASVLHNTVQARLYAAAIQLETAALEGDTERAKEALKYAREALDQSTPDPFVGTESVADRLGELVTAWTGIVRIDVLCPGDLLMSAPAKFAIDAAEECVANAVRHAQASHIDVRLDVDGTDLVLCVEDNGAAPSVDSAPGLGTTWMERVSRGQFSRTRTETGTNLVVMRVAAGE
jgi:hypothetical protein